MKFLIRADASIDIGSGHIMRCLTLARALREQGHEVSFICRDLPGHLFDFICQQGFSGTLLPAGSLNRLPETPSAAAVPHAAWLPVSQAQDAEDCRAVIAAQKPDWIVADHYALSATWERQVLAAHSAKLMVIDDLADRHHCADLLVDQNLGHSPEDYQNLVPASCRLLVGTRYALLRPEFAQWRPASLQRRYQTSGRLQNILLNLGGVDKDNHSLAILQALEEVMAADHHAVQVTIVMGVTAPHTPTIQAYAAQAPYPCRVLVNVSNMAELMSTADLAIGAAGSTSWERCCLGLPSLMLVLADNQRIIAEQLQAAGVACMVDNHDLNNSLGKLLARPASTWQMQSQRAAALCDGQGTTRILNHLAYFSGARIRPATPADSPLFFQWRNHPDIRRFMFNTDEIEWEQHCNWFARQQDNPDFCMLAYMVADTPQGYASFKHLGNGIHEWGFYLAPSCPRGHGRTLGYLALQYAFHTLQAQEIQAQVLHHNTASLALHRKLGFQPRTTPGTEPQTVSFKLRPNEFLF